MYRFIVLALTVFAVSAWADNFNITASERGWVCTPGSTCHVGATNNLADPANDYFAGFIPGQGQFRNWFEFAIPTLTGGPLVSATLKLDDKIHLGGTLMYAVYGLGAQPMVFTDVTTSNPFGSVSTTGTSNNTTLSITLDATALAAITGDQGGNIFIGGIDSGETSSSRLGAGDFDVTLGANSTLSLTTAPSAVPETSSLVLLGTIIIVAVLVGWRRQTIRA